MAAVPTTREMGRTTKKIAYKTQSRFFGLFGPKTTARGSHLTHAKARPPQRPRACARGVMRGGLRLLGVCASRRWSLGLRWRAADTRPGCAHPRWRRWTSCTATTASCTT
jgi:hypothetical protein